MVAKFDKLIEPKNLGWKILDILPEVLNAGEDAGVLTEEGAKKLDPSAHSRQAPHSVLQKVMQVLVW